MAGRACFGCLVSLDWPSVGTVEAGFLWWFALRLKRFCKTSGWFKILDLSLADFEER